MEGRDASGSGLAKQGARSPAVADVRTGQESRVERVEKHWLVYDADQAVLGRLRWRAADEGKIDPRYGTSIHYPRTGTLHVTRLLTENGSVVDFGGYVTPS